MRPERMRMPSRFGSAMSPFITSEKFQIGSSSVVQPMNTTREKMIRNGSTPRRPTRRSTFCDALDVPVAVVGRAEEGGEGEDDDADGAHPVAPLARQPVREGLAGHQRRADLLTGGWVDLVPGAGGDDRQSGEAADDDRV